MNSWYFLYGESNNIESDNVEIFRIFWKNTHWELGARLDKALHFLGSGRGSLLYSAFGKKIISFIRIRNISYRIITSFTGCKLEGHVRKKKMKGLLEGKDKIQHDYKEKAEMKSCNKIEKIEENAGSREKNLKSSEEKYRVEGLRLKIGRLDLR